MEEHDNLLTLIIKLLYKIKGHQKHMKGQIYLADQYLWCVSLITM